MKTSTGLISLISLIFLYSSVSAQEFSVRTGINLSGVGIDSVLNTHEYSNYKDVTGFQMGMLVEFPITNVFSFEMKALLNQKGFERDRIQVIDTDTLMTHETVTTFYIDIPFTFKLTHDFGNFKISGEIGPYIGFGVSGSVKSENIESFQASEYDIEWGTLGFNDRFDFGFVMGTGVEIESYVFWIDYSQGILGTASPLTVSSQDNKNVKVDILDNYVLSFTVGYKFLKK